MSIGLEYLRFRKGVSYGIHMVNHTHLAVGYSPSGKLLSLEYDGEDLNLEFNETIKISYDL